MKIRKNRSNILFAFFLLLSLAGSSFPASICNKHSFKGLDHMVERSKMWVGDKNTSNVSEARIYITVENGRFYAQSNYIPKNVKPDDGGPVYPTKLTTDTTDIRSLRAVAEKIVRDLSLSNYQKIKDIKFFIDKKVFQGMYGELDTADMGNISIIDENGKPRPATSYILSDEKRLVAEKMTPRLWTPMQRYVTATPAEKIELLKSLPFSPRKEFALLSLAPDTATNIIIDKNIPKSMRVDFSPESPDLSRKRLRDAFSKHKNKVVGVLVHYENGEFVFRDSLSIERFRISLSELQEIAREFGIFIYPLGCKSFQSDGIGPVADVNTLKMAQKLVRAAKANNHFDFWDELSDGSPFIIDLAVISSAKNRIQITVKNSETYPGDSENSGGGSGGGNNGGGGGSGRGDRAKKGPVREIKETETMYQAEFEVSDALMALMIADDNKDEKKEENYNAAGVSKPIIPESKHSEAPEIMPEKAEEGSSDGLVLALIIMLTGGLGFLGFVFIKFMPFDLIELPKYETVKDEKKDRVREPVINMPVARFLVYPDGEIVEISPR